jgi:hypothetical protein
LSLSPRSRWVALFYLRRNSALPVCPEYSQGVLGFFYSVAYFIVVALMEGGHGMPRDRLFFPIDKIDNIG